eukprot:28889_1
MNTLTSNNKSAIKYNHLSVELRCSILSRSLTQHPIVIRLPSPDDWAMNLDFIVKSITNKFTSWSHIDSSQWLLITDHHIINPFLTDPVKFGELLCTQIVPPATFYIIDSKTLLSSYAQKQAHPTPLNTASTTPSLSNEANETANEIIDDMPAELIHSLQCVITQTHAKRPKAKPDFKLNWKHLVQCIKHEMWPVLASVIEGMLDTKKYTGSVIIDIDDLSDKCTNNVIQTLKKERRLPKEECDYLKQLIIRAKGFNPHQSKFNVQDINDRDAHYRSRGLNESLLMDIYDTHKTFVFANFNFKAYPTSEFVTNVTNAFE